MGKPKGGVNESIGQMWNAFLNFRLEPPVKRLAMNFMQTDLPKDGG
ncbi:hypothetical protein PsyrH_26285 [Pseudomonas syringae pv. syringae HS191]|uniref:Uncharacterized protein n=1 Tax=Pseudomonas syringae TaxID=317 RepID=A0AB38BYZ6_PSESX|nr:hypothetical protein PsyrH_26285 [Pseudomonas syringae pv. syringae HS191]SFO42179.1 hypothetical protein SAMN05444065_117111 [Pseudomonas syringae]SFO75577.1 hypothetical protein SAMN05444063_118111 [Pseudomonas syringae]